MEVTLFLPFSKERIDIVKFFKNSGPSFFDGSPCFMGHDH